MVVGSNIEIRPTVYVVFQVDGRVVQAKRAMRAFRRFRRWIEHPHELEGYSGGDGQLLSGEEGFFGIAEQTARRMVGERSQTQ